MIHLEIHYYETQVERIYDDFTGLKKKRNSDFQAQPLLYKDFGHKTNEQLILKQNHNSF